MDIILYSDKMDEYLKHDSVIDYDNKAIIELADTLFKKADNELDFIRNAYEFVRDKISHSADINEDIITCAASEVLKAGHGICFAKSHLLASLLRCKAIPTGFCYQKLILDDEAAPVLVYHGLNGVYIKDYKKWIRLDARGNKTGVNAQFSIETEQLAFPIRSELGEVDSFVVYPNPDIAILEKLKKSKTRTELWKNLPTELEYNKQYWLPVCRGVAFKEKPGFTKGDIVSHNIAETFELLFDKNNNVAYRALQELQKESEETDCVYPYMDRLSDMLDSDNSYVRTRGLTLLAYNAKWDKDYKIERNSKIVEAQLPFYQKFTESEKIGI